MVVSFKPKPATDDELVELYADLVKFTRKEIEQAQDRLAEYARKLAEASANVANR